MKYAKASPRGGVSLRKNTSVKSMLIESSCGGGSIEHNICLLDYYNELFRIYSFIMEVNEFDNLKDSDVKSIELDESTYPYITVEDGMKF